MPCSFCSSVSHIHHKACPNDTTDPDIKRQRQALFSLGQSAGKQLGLSHDILSRNSIGYNSFRTDDTFAMGVFAGEILRQINHSKL